MERDKGGLQKSVTLAPTSRYLTDRQYAIRKPLFSAEHHASLLKTTNPQKETEKVKQSGVSKTEHTQMNLTRSREELALESARVPHRHISPPSASTEDFGSSLALSELMASMCHEEPTYGLHSSGSRSAHLSLPGSSLEVQRLNTPLRSQTTSIVPHPTYITPSQYSRTGKAQFRLGGYEGRGRGETELCSYGHSKTDPMSFYQANHWACAIPKALPPSLDRHSAGWDPNREYQALLDYTYPLRPGQVTSGSGSSELQEDSLLQTSLQDSGIEVEHLCSSTILTGLDFSVDSSGRTRERTPVGSGHRSPDLPPITRSSHGLPSSTPLSPTKPVGLSMDSLDLGKHRGGLKRVGHRHQPHALSFSTSTAFIRTTSVFPQSRCAFGEVDEEFWSLPEQLVELHLLSRQVKEVTALLSRPVAASWESLEPGTTSVLSSTTLPEKQEAEVTEGVGQNPEEGKADMVREEWSSAQMGNCCTAAFHKGSEAVTRGSGAWVEPVGGGLSLSSLREVEALVEQLCGPALPGSQSRQDDEEQCNSLMQHIQVFCSHLEQLIQQLYTMLEKMELLAVPAVDTDGVKSSLAEYQSLQRDVSSHQPQTSCVLHTGKLLLNCINTMSPLLRDVLLLIERQSGALQSHTDDLFSSVLPAMDSLTQSSPAGRTREEDPRPVVFPGSTL